MFTIVDWGREQGAMGGRINPLQDDEIFSMPIFSIQNITLLNESCLGAEDIHLYTSCLSAKVGQWKE